MLYSNMTMDTSRRRLVLFLEDGARPDYLFGDRPSINGWKPFFTSLLESDPTHTTCTTMRVDPPTSTTQGVKTLLTGGMRSFIELGQTFFSSSLSTDHWLSQLHMTGTKRIHHVGDMVWRELSGNQFNNSITINDSYDIFTDDTDIIQNEINLFCSSSSLIDILIIHSLLVDHNAHKTSTSSPLNPFIHDGLLKFNSHLSFLTSNLPKNTLLLVFGDHGLNEWGNHGGATHDEITTALCAYSSSSSISSFTSQPHIRDLASTIAYYFNVPSPFTNLGIAMSNLLPSLTHMTKEGGEIAYMIDNTDQVLRFASSHHKTQRIDTERYELLKRDYEKMNCHVLSSTHCRNIIQNLKRVSIETISSIQSIIDNSHIRYELCYLGLIIMILPLLHGDIIMMIRHVTVSSLSSLFLLILYLCSFTSYRLLIYPGGYPLVLTLISLLPTFVTSPITAFRIIIPMILSFIPFSSSICTIILLFLPLCTSTSELSLLQAVSGIFYLYQPHNTQYTLPSIIACISYCLLTVRYPSSSSLLDSLTSLLMIFVGKHYSYSLLCLLSTYHTLKTIHIDTLRERIMVLSIALHYTYLTIPTFSFSSLHWSAAFVLTHNTRVVIQALSMMLGTFYAYIILGHVINRRKLKELLMIQVLVTTVSTLFNTASPVIWSVFTPFLLFVMMIWLTLLIL